MHMNLLKEDQADTTIPGGEATHLDWPFPAAHAASEITDDDYDDMMQAHSLEMLGRVMVYAVAAVGIGGALLTWWLA